MKQTNQKLDQKYGKKSSNVFSSTVSQEFKSPLVSSLMFLQILMGEVMGEHAKHMLKIIISQINLLLCLFNDILDLKLIEESKFLSKNEVFKPKETFSFIKTIFGH